MQISTNDWKNYIDRLSKLNQKAASEMQKYVAANGFADTDALIDFCYALVTKYGEGSAELACQMYDAMAEMANASVDAAVPAATATYAETARAVQGSLLQSPTGQKLPQIADRLVKQAAADTTLQNAIRDHAQWAWVPSGDTCGFCITLASNGWQRASKRVLRGNHATHIHANCDCMFAIRFSENDNVKGYDPDYYKKLYDEAPGGSSSEKVKALRRQLEDRDKINAQKRAAYAKNKEILESERSNRLRKSLVQETLINETAINDNNYRLRLDRAINNTTESRAVENVSREIFEHRNGTHFEDLAYIDSNNGAFKINKNYDYYDEEQGISRCKANKPMKKMLRESDPYTIIGVHNHPSSGAPSTDDIASAFNKKYKYGIVACHNGNIYKYKVESDAKIFVEQKANTKPAVNPNIEFSLVKLEKGVYNNRADKVSEAIKELSEYGIKMEVI